MYLRAYRLIARVIHRLPLPAGKLRTSVAGRRAAAARWMKWAAEARTDGPLAWIHAASVGEALTAQPVVSRLRAALPTLQVIHTYSSPAAAQWADPFGANMSGYVPLDEPAPVARALDAIRPSLLVFSRGDLWPELVAQAASRSIPMAVLGATLEPGSQRLRRSLRPLYARMHGVVSWLGALSPEHAERWIQLGIPHDTVHVTGDPRHDQVLERIPRLRPLGRLPDWATGGATLVAGSTDAQDEAVLLEAARQMFEHEPDARLLVVPHEPSDAKAAEILRQAGRLGVAACVWTSSDHLPTTRCVVVRQLGLLFDLYALGTMAYVGGGFRPGRLHAVIEPAAYGLPVVIGPHWQRFDDARGLIEAGGATALNTREPAAALATWWSHMSEQEDRRAATGLAARQTLHEGAASRTAAALLLLLECTER